MFMTQHDVKQNSLLLLIAFVRGTDAIRKWRSHRIFDY